MGREERNDGIRQQFSNTTHLKKKKKEEKYYFYLRFQLEDDNTVFPLSPHRHVLYICRFTYIIVKQSEKKIQRLGGTLLLLWYMDMISVTNLYILVGVINRVSHIYYLGIPCY